MTKWGIGRNRARCLPLEEAYARIEQTLTRALRTIDRYKPFKPSLPAEVVLTFYRSDMADACETIPGAQRVDGRTWKASVNSLRDIRPW